MVDDISSQVLLSLAPIAGATVNVAIHITLSRFSAAASPLRAVIWGACAGAIATALVATSSGIAVGDALPWSLLCYTATALGYWAFVNLHLTSLRIRVVKTLLESGGDCAGAGMAAPAEDASAVVSRRLERLEKLRFIEVQGGRFILTSRVLVGLRIVIDAVRTALKLGARG